MRGEDLNSKEVCRKWKSSWVGREWARHDSRVAVGDQHLAVAPPSGMT